MGTTPRAVRHGETRARILASAWELARSEGLALLSLRALADRVGMRAPSLYSYFPSKNAIYDAMFAEGNAALLARLEPIATSRRGTPRSRLRRGAQTWMAFCLEDPVRHQLLYQRTIPGFEPSGDSLALAQRVLELLGRGLAETGRTSARDADLFTAYLTGLAAQQIANDPGGDRWSRLLDDTLGVLVVGVPVAREGR